MKTREGTLDDFIVAEQGSYQPLFTNYSGGPVLDIGACIGAFSEHYGKKFPDSQFYGYEPEEENFALAIENTKHLQNVSLQKVAVSTAEDTIGFYINKKKNKGLHSVVPFNGRSRVVVQTVSFLDMLEEIQPEVIKMDIEGGEYDLEEILCNLPECVKAVAIELHFTKPGFKERAGVIRASLLARFKFAPKNPELKDCWAAVYIFHN